MVDIVVNYISGFFISLRPEVNYKTFLPLFPTNETYIEGEMVYEFNSHSM